MVAGTAELFLLEGHYAPCRHRYSRDVSLDRVVRCRRSRPCAAEAASERRCLAGEFNGESNYMNTGHIIAGSPKIFGQMVGLLAEFA